MIYNKTMPFQGPIYLDYHATTPVDPRVFDEMKPFFSKIFGNPASQTHLYGWQAEEAVKIAAERVSSLIGADPSEITWTSGTTESINLALKGVADGSEGKKHFITCVIEHKAVLETCRFLEKIGHEVTYLPVDQEGFIDVKSIETSIRPETVLISVIAAHHEIGVVQNIKDIGKIAKERKILFHVDAAQACGKIPIQVESFGIDLLSMSSHKLYGPKGIGALYVRRRAPHVRLNPQIHGGFSAQEIRAGTLPVPLIVGMGMAFEVARREMENESRELLGLRELLLVELKKGCSDLLVNGSLAQRLPGNLNVSFPGTKSSDLLSKVHDVALSSGSACASGDREPSYVLTAMGFSKERANSSIRFGLGRYTTEQDIMTAAHQVSKAVATLRA